MLFYKALVLASVKELYDVIDDERTLIIDARSFSEYAKGHIPGAVSLDFFSFHWVDTTPKGIEAFTEQARLLLSMVGVDEKKHVFVYDDKSGMLAARGVWMLHYLSHPNTVMLDGGLEEWKKSYTLETEPRKPVPSSLRTPPNPTLIAGYADILAGGDLLYIIDSRTPDEYSGKLVRAARAGHIPNAKNINWELGLDKDGKILTNKELSTKYDVPHDARIVTYCQGGYRAAHGYVALKTLGYQDVRVYLGSWGEWGNRPELPVQ